MASLYKKPVILRDPRTGRRVKTKSKKWWGRFRDASGQEKRVPLAVDRTAAQTMLGEWVRRVEREKAGLIEPRDEHRKRPLSQHLADYRQYLKSKANEPRYIDMAVARVKALLTGCRFKHIGHIRPTAVANWLRMQRETDQFGIATSNDYLVAAKAFCNWLVRDGRLAHNPIRHLQRLNAETDVRRQHRVLTPDELRWLLAAAEQSKRRLGRMKGHDRAIVYQFAALTGLRAQELASLTARSFDLQASPPTVCVAACYSKHRRTDMLPLAESLVERLGVYLAERAADTDPNERLWPGKWYRKAGEILMYDLEAARTAWLDEAKERREWQKRRQSHFLDLEDEAGRVADFHALRHGFITYLVAANVPRKVAQMLARHSTITLTMDRYTHMGIVDLVDGLKRLPTSASQGPALARA
jgi:site-specific recombinase XerD